MSTVTVEGKLLKWGNSYGIRISKKSVEELHLRTGTTLRVEVAVPAKGKALAWSEMPTFNLGGDASARHDEIFAEASAEAFEEKMGRPKARK